VRGSTPPPATADEQDKNWIRTVIFSHYQSFMEFLQSFYSLFRVIKMTNWVKSWCTWCDQAVSGSFHYWEFPETSKHQWLGDLQGKCQRVICRCTRSHRLLKLGDNESPMHHLPMRASEYPDMTLHSLYIHFSIIGRGWGKPRDIAFLVSCIKIYVIDIGHGKCGFPHSRAIMLLNSRSPRTVSRTIW